MDRVHDQGALYGDEGANSRVSTLQLLHDEPVRHISDACTTISVQVCAEQAEIGNGLDEVGGKLAPLKRATDDGHDLFVDQGSHGVPDLKLFFRKLIVEL